MPKLEHFDFDRISFDADTMQVVSVSRNKTPVLPLSRSPLNFSVLRSDGLFSNRWGVSTSKYGDVYVYCRDAPNTEKISLHTSGEQHISITSKVAAELGIQNRYGPVWTQPEFEQQAIATFTLLFPPWGVGIAPEIQEITKDELVIIGHKEKIVVVSFFIADSSRNMQSQLPHFILGRLALQQGRTLHVIAWKEPQNDLLDKVRAVFPQASQTLFELGLGEQDYNLNVQGFREPNSAYLVTVPVHYIPARLNE